MPLNNEEGKANAWKQNKRCGRQGGGIQSGDLSEVVAVKVQVGGKARQSGGETLSGAAGGLG